MFERGLFHTLRSNKPGFATWCTINVEALLQLVYILDAHLIYVVFMKKVLSAAAFELWAEAAVYLPCISDAQWKNKTKDYWHCTPGMPCGAAENWHLPCHWHTCHHVYGTGLAIAFHSPCFHFTLASVRACPLLCLSMPSHLLQKILYKGMIMRSP